MIATKSIGVLAGLLYLLLWPAHTVAQEADWERHLRAGGAAYQQGNYAEAEKQWSETRAKVIRLATLAAATTCDTKACVKEVLDRVLFAETWRTPDRTTWVAKGDQDFAVVAPPAIGYHQIDPKLQLGAIDRFGKLLRSRYFPRFSGTRLVPYSDVTFPAFFIAVFTPSEFEKYIDFYWGTERLAGPKDDIERGCLYWIAIGAGYLVRERSILDAKVVMRSTLPEREMDRCLEDAVYHALGLVAERDPSRELALQVLYHPLVLPGMSRTELFELIDSGVIPVPK